MASAINRLPAYAWVIAGTTAVVNGVAWGIPQGTFGVFFSPLADEMGWSRTALSSVFSLHLLVNAVLGIFWGWLSDRWSIRGVILISGVLMGVGVFLSSMAHSLWQLYLFYGFIGGVGLGGTAGPLAALAMRWLRDRPALAVSVGYAGIGAGTAGLAVLADRLIAYGGWRFAFQSLAFLVWAAFLVGFILLREFKTSQGRRGAAHESVAASEQPHTEPEPEPEPVEHNVPLAGAVTTRAFWTLFGMVVIATLGMFLTLVHLVPRAIDLGVPTGAAAILLTMTSLLDIGGKLSGGMLGDRFGHQRMFALSMFLVCLAMLWLAISSSLWMLMVFAVAFGLVNGLWTIQFPALAAQHFGTKHLGAIVGAVLLGAGIGGVTGPVMAGFVFDTTESYRIAFILGAAIAFAGGLLAISFPSQPSRRFKPESRPEVKTA